MHSHFEGHRRTASLPSGPLLNTGGLIGPLKSLLCSPSPVFPSLSQFKKVLDETQGAQGVNDAAVLGNLKKNFKYIFSRLFETVTPRTKSNPTPCPFFYLDEDVVEPYVNGIRILSWNLDGLSLEKARNPGVINVVGNLLTRYHIKVAVIEGVADPLGLKEVNHTISTPCVLQHIVYLFIFSYVKM